MARQQLGIIPRAGKGVESHLFFSFSGERPGGSTGRKEGKLLGELTGEEGELALEKAIYRRLCGEVGRYGWLTDHAVVCVLCELEFREECGH